MTLEKAQLRERHAKLKEIYADFYAWLLQYLDECDPMDLQGPSGEYAPEVAHILAAVATPRSEPGVACTIRDIFTEHFGRRHVGTLSDYYPIAEVIHQKWEEVSRPEPTPPPPCPKCGSENVLPLVYGMPAPEASKAAQRGEIALGGCVIDETYRRWQCAQCGSSFNDGGKDLLEPIDYRAEWLRQTGARE